MGRHKVKIYKAVKDGEHALKLEVVFLHADYGPKLSLVLPQLLLDIFFLEPPFLLSFRARLYLYLLYYF